MGNLIQKQSLFPFVVTVYSFDLVLTNKLIVTPASQMTLTSRERSEGGHHIQSTLLMGLEHGANNLSGLKTGQHETCLCHPTIDVSSTKVALAYGPNFLSRPFFLCCLSCAKCVQQMFKSFHLINTFWGQHVAAGQRHKDMAVKKLERVLISCPRLLFLSLAPPGPLFL